MHDEISTAIQPRQEFKYEEIDNTYPGLEVDRDASYWTREQEQDDTPGGGWRMVEKVEALVVIRMLDHPQCMDSLRRLQQDLGKFAQDIGPEYMVAFCMWPAGTQYRPIAEIRIRTT